MPTPSAARPHSIDDYRRGYEEERRLRGFRSACGFTTATWGLACPRCGLRDLEDVDLPQEGRVTAFTIQNVPSDEFLNDAPYAYVVVELEGGARVTGWIPAVRSEREIAIGDRVRFVASYRAGVHFEKTEPGPTGA